MISSRGLPFTLEIAVLLLVYILYALVFLKFREPSSAARKKAPGTIVGAIILQSLSYSVAWTFRRPDLDPWRTERPGLAAGVVLLSIILAMAGVALTAWAKKTLGRQWGLAARVVIDHKLVTGGPFRYSRHPLYLGMAGLLLATVLGLSSLFGAVLALVLFSLGTAIRVGAEEKLLREAFGAEFEDYRHRVPCFIPRPGKKY